MRCDTESRGHTTPNARSPLELVVNAPDGFIPLWAEGTTLRWRIRDSSLQSFANPKAAASEIEQLFGEAILRWGEAAPVKFTKQSDLWDFEVVMRNADDCDVNGCVLASSFFPDAGRHQLILYPKMFSQPREEQVETLIHETGHIFGLRHFFAQVSESAFPSQVFGTHSKFSIMNYGADSVLTGDDKADLKKLYRMAWAGDLTEINGTPIKFVRPFHTVGEAATSGLLAAQTLARARLPRMHLG
ncbi:conserved hypothetical protein [Bradyrhizobium sp. ORS 278]|nr:conserved hypothetical protein [Bradyrhizobium sp. ORS 278]